jgi:hypothetical protein
VGIFTALQAFTALAGFWSLFHAVIHWNLLSCPPAPQYFDSPPSVNSAPACVSGEMDFFFFFFSVHLILIFTTSWLGYVLEL